MQHFHVLLHLVTMPFNLWIHHIHEIKPGVGGMAEATKFLKQGCEVLLREECSLEDHLVEILELTTGLSSPPAFVVELVD